MKSIKTFITAASVVLLASGVSAQAGDPKFMSADEVKKAFAKGSITCSWKAGKKGKDKGTDFYYKDESSTSGSADRNIGKSSTLQGKWSISGGTLSLMFGGVGEPQMYKLVKVEGAKKSYTAYLNGKKKKMTFKCK